MSAPLFSFSGGLGRISNWVIDCAPCRLEVPIQSDPVSPPPITTTCLPLALKLPCGAARASPSPATRLFCCVRNSIAKWMPDNSRPSTSRSRGLSAPPAMTSASYSSSKLRHRNRQRPLRCRRGTDALALHLLKPAVDHALFHFEIGDAIAQQAADSVVLLEHGDVVPGARQLLGAGQTRRAGTDHRNLAAGFFRRDHEALSSLPPNRDRRSGIRWF